MALNIDTQDLDNYPGIVKRVTIDNEKIVPVGYDGDEQFTLGYATSAYSDATNRTAIQDTYITDLKVGWHKSSGFAGSSGKFSLDSTHTDFKIKVDTTASGSDGNGYYTITLDYNDDERQITGEIIADDMETKIRALSLETPDVGFALAYSNVTVEYYENRFWVFSGTMGRYYTGSSRSSVHVKAADTNDCSVVLGFNLGWTSQELDSAGGGREALVGSSYTTDTTPLTISAGTGVDAGDAILITDGTNTDYFTALAGTTDTSIVVPVSGTNGYVGIANSYTVTVSKVQILKSQDPDGEPKLWYDSVDKINRHGLEIIMSQIDYSS